MSSTGSNSADDTSGVRISSPIRRIRRGLVAACIGIAALIFAVLLLFNFSFFRNRVLMYALARAERALPGEFAVREAAWPRIGSVELDGVAWVDGGDTLLAAEEFRLTVAVGSLFRRDLNIRRVLLTGLSADVPLLRTKFPSGGAEQPSGTAGNGPPLPYIREGSVAGLPSVRVDRFELTAKEIRLDSKNEVTALRIAGGLSASRHESPALSIERCSMQGFEGRHGIDSLRLNVDVGREAVSGYGAGFVEYDHPFRLNISSASGDSIIFDLSFGGFANRNTGLTLGTKLERKGFKVLSFVFDGRAIVPPAGELKSLDVLSSRMEKVPDLGEAIVTINGSVGLTPSLTAKARCDFQSDGPLHGGCKGIAYSLGALAVDSLYLAVPDLTFYADAVLTSEALSAKAECSIAGGRWLEIVSPGAKRPEKLTGNVHVAVEGDIKGKLNANLEASAGIEGYMLEHLRLDAVIPADTVTPTQFDIRIRVQDMNAALRGELARGTQVELRLSPIWLTMRRPGAAQAPPPSLLNGRITFDPNRKNVEAANLQIRGALGNMRVSGRMYGNKKGRYRLHCEWPQVPDILVEKLKVAGEKRDTLAARWMQGRPFVFDANGTFQRDGGKNTIVSSAVFKLPGPGVFSSMFPSFVETADMGPLSGRIDIQSMSAGAGSITRCTANLDSTEWIDSSAVQIKLEKGRFGVDTVGIAVEGLFLGVSGAREQETWDLQGRFSLAEGGLLKRFSSAALENASADIGGNFRVVKSPYHMDASGNASGSFRSNNFGIGRFYLDTKLDRDGMRTNLRVGEGLSLPAVQLDSLIASFQSMEPGGGIFPGQVYLHARGMDLELLQKLRVDVSPHLSIVVDTLAVGLQKRYMSSVRPFEIALAREHNSLTVTDVELTGEMGSIQAGAYVSPDSTHMLVTADVTFPEMPPSVNISSNLWPERLSAQIRAEGSSRLSANVGVSGITLGDGRRPLLNLQAEGSRDSLTANFSVTDSSGTIVQGYALLPASISLRPFSLRLADAPVHLDVDIHRFPVGAYLIGETSRSLPSHVIQLDGRGGVRGKASSPSAYFHSEITFPQWSNLAGYRLLCDAQLSPDAGLDSALAHQLESMSERDVARMPLSDAAGLDGVLSLQRNGQAVLTGTLVYPVGISLKPLLAQTDPDGRIESSVSSQQIQLADFAPLLPPDLRLDGLFSLDFSAENNVRDPDLNGRIKGRDLRIAFKDEVNLLAQSDIRISGSGRRPVIEGNVEIQSGVLRVPEPPKNLHPAEGTAILWEAAEEPSPSDGVPHKKSQEVTAGGKQPFPQLDLNVGLSIPSGFWIRGQGLDVELSGKLNVKQKGALPVITGSLRAVRGQFLFSGRLFQLDRGEVVFYGEEEINPSLDVELSAIVDETLIRITVRGTVKELDLQFASEPEMTEGDIMSLLLLGRRLDELNDDQFDLLQRRATDLLSAFGTTRLAGRLSRQLGVDMVQIRSRREGQNGRALIIGKYLSRRLLVKYEQLLEEATFLINLEYFLTRRLKVETLYGRSDQSGIELDWTKEY